MANPDHLNKLKQGAESWNQWRKNHPEINPDLSHVSIHEQVDPIEGLSRMNLSGVDFQSADLSGLKIQGTDLTGAKLQAAILRGAKLQSIGHGGGKFSTCGTETILEGANLIGADLTDADVYGVTYDNKMKCFGIRAAGCHGSQLFTRHVLDLAYIEETKEKHPFKYWLWMLTSDCGRSIGQWALISIVAALIFGAIFANYQVWDWLPDGLQSFLTAIAPKMSYSNPVVADGWFTPYYFSIVTFTTLGFGDVTPTNTAGQIWLSLEVVLGYVMLGGLITLFATKMVRQSG